MGKTLQQRAAVAAAGQHVEQRTAHPRHAAQRQQRLLLVGRQGAQDGLVQVGGQLVGTAREGRQRRGRIGVRAHEVAGHAQRDRPALGALQQQRHVALGHRARTVAQQGLGLLEAHAQVGRAQLGQRMLGAQLGQADVGQDARRDHQVQPGRGPLDQLPHQVVQRATQPLVVVEEQQAAAGFGQRRGQQPRHRRPARDGRYRGRGRRRLPQRGQCVVDEAFDLRVFRLQADPAHAQAVRPAAVEPARQQFGLAVPGRCHQQRGVARQRGRQAVQRVAALHHVPESRRRCQLGLDQPVHGARSLRAGPGGHRGAARTQPQRPGERSSMPGRSTVSSAPAPGPPSPRSAPGSWRGRAWPRARRGRRGG